MPGLLLLLAFLVLSESAEQILALLNLSIGIGVDNLCQVLHESEVCTHLVGQSSHLAQLRNQSNLVTGLAVFVDE